jgi:hypothetical protein
VTIPHSRLSFAERYLGITHNENNFLTSLITRDEAHFHLDGFTNTHNCRIWATENPVVIHEKPLHPERVTVWCAICSTDVIGLYLGFEVLTAVSMKIAVFWVVAPCSLVEVLGLAPCSLVELLPDYTVLQPRRQQSSLVSISLRMKWADHLRLR